MPHTASRQLPQPVLALVAEAISSAVDAPPRNASMILDLLTELQRQTIAERKLAQENQLASRDTNTTNGEGDA